VAAIRQACADDINLDIGVVLVSDQSYSEATIQLLCDALTDLCLS
jgi:hypothetical protein